MMSGSHNVSEDTPVTNGYSPVPRRRRGNRRAQGGSAIGGREPRLVGIEVHTPAAEISEDEDLATWLKEQRPPHYE